MVAPNWDIGGVVTALEMTLGKQYAVRAYLSQTIRSGRREGANKPRSSYEKRSMSDLVRQFD